MADDKLSAPLQISILAALCFDDKQGAAIAAQLTANHFDDVYRDFVTQVLVYRKKHNRAPNKDIRTLASRVGRDDSFIQKRLIPQLFVEAQGLNGDHLLGRVEELVRRQTIKSTLQEAIDRFEQDDERMPDEVEAILHKALRSRANGFSAGVFLTEKRALNFLTRQQEDFIPLGIRELDRRRVGMVPKQLMLYIAAKGSGKSWFCVHCGRQALIQGQKVVHVSLEMSTDQVLGRYFQCLFGAAVAAERYDQMMLQFDKVVKDKLIGFDFQKGQLPELSFEDKNIKNKLLQGMDDLRLKGRMGGLVVTDFPTSTLTVDQLIGYLDYLEATKGFIPNVLIVDYPKLMHQDRRDLRVSIGRTLEELRGIAVKRNLAVICPHQGTRSTIGAKRVRSTMASEDITVVQTADIVLAYSRTPQEEDHGLGRLHLEHSRGTAAGATVLLSQSYATGQYVISSALLQQVFWDWLREKGGDGEEVDDDSE